MQPVPAQTMMRLSQRKLAALYISLICSSLGIAFFLFCYIDDQLLRRFGGDLSINVVIDDQDGGEPACTPAQETISKVKSLSSVVTCFPFNPSSSRRISMIFPEPSHVARSSIADLYDIFALGL